MAKMESKITPVESKGPHRKGPHWMTEGMSYEDAVDGMGKRAREQDQSTRSRYQSSPTPKPAASRPAPLPDVDMGVGEIETAAPVEVDIKPVATDVGQYEIPAHIKSQLPPEVSAYLAGLGMFKS